MNEKKLQRNPLVSLNVRTREDRRERDSVIIERRPDYEPVTAVIDREASEADKLFQIFVNLFHKIAHFTFDMLTSLRVSRLNCA